MYFLFVYSKCTCAKKSLVPKPEWNPTVNDLPFISLVDKFWEMPTLGYMQVLLDSVDVVKLYFKRPWC